MADAQILPIRYSAFLSYNHRDMARARRLQRRLEAYRLPRRLVGQPGKHGPVPARLLPVCRDRDDMVAASDLSDAIREALAQSGHLIVVCSPNAIGSKWMAVEIETFRACYPGRPILTAIMEGLPEDCLPEAVRVPGPDGKPGQPLAADFQESGDGDRLALLKIVAVLAGVGLDQLVRRDAQRRTRRIAVVATGTLLAALLLGAAALVAIRAREAAAAQHGMTGKLVDSFDGLRKKFRQAGRLDAIEALNRPALDYLQGKDPADMADDALEQRAKVLLADGDLDQTRGDDAKATGKFAEAYRLTTLLLARQPGDPKRIFAHAQSEYYVGYNAWRRGDAKSAEANFRRYIALAKRLVAADPQNSDWLREEANADTNLGVLLFRQYGDGAGAEQVFARALARFQEAAKVKSGDPEIPYEISDAYAWLADSQRIQGHYADAMANRVKERELCAALARADPRNLELKQALVSNALGIARIEDASGDHAGAAKRLAAARKEEAALVAAQPDNRDLAKQARMLELFELSFRLAMLRKVSITKLPIRDNVGHCSTDKMDTEISSFCNILKARIAVLNGNGSVLATNSLNVDGGASSKPRLSNRWGIDFAKEYRIGNNGTQKGEQR